MPMPDESQPFMANMHTDRLIEDAKNGVASAQGKLVKIWYKRIYNFAFKFFGDHDLAMEAAQKTFISMLRGLPRLNDISRFKPWLYTISLNQCKEEQRREKSKRSVSIGQFYTDQDGGQSAVFEIAAKKHDNSDQRILRHELAEILQNALGRLPEEQRVVLIMKEYEGLKFKEIAEVLRISENTAKSRLYTGLKSMQQLLKEQNITKETVGYEI